jgi:hypothetical protein
VLSDGTIIPQDGAFRAVNGIRLAEITDGLTNTLLVTVVDAAVKGILTNA